MISSPEIELPPAPPRARVVEGLVPVVETAAPRHRWFLLHLAGRAAALVMRSVPRRLRFGATVWVARALRPVIRRTAAYREQRQQGVDGLGEITLFRVLTALDNARTPYDPAMRVEGWEEMEAAIRSGQGVLLVGPHTMLSGLVPRHLHDRGAPALVIAAPPSFPLAGAGRDAEVVFPSPTFLLSVRSRLRAGKIVCGMIDRGDDLRRRSIHFATPGGTVQIADALIPLAVRCGARVVFIAVRTEGSAVVARFAAPSPASRTADTVTADFIAFVRAHVERAVGAAADPSPPAHPAPLPALSPDLVA